MGNLDIHSRLQYRCDGPDYRRRRQHPAELGRDVVCDPLYDEHPGEDPFSQMPSLLDPVTHCLNRVCMLPVDSDPASEFPHCDYHLVQGIDRGYRRIFRNQSGGVHDLCLVPDREFCHRSHSEPDRRLTDPIRARA